MPSPRRVSNQLKSFRLGGIFATEPEVRQSLLGHSMKGETANYSHGSPAWGQQVREAVHLLDVDYRQQGVAITRGDDRHCHQQVIGLEQYKRLKGQERNWSGKGDLNPRPSPWQGEEILIKTMA